ncbi:SulP family inorganic anion transporter [Nocardia camponoti]|uniref:carbonic anhydrase n=1 Tax=Nocardia camponoti TaxID=1616106 RepID=A0A917QB12_9NOCA|nr:bifunctional SulP family inorganic anion transporter/carbonic anhydrase [Nocardia camponoti]GGK40382.1 putative transmembrane carbonic anhydrase [Nocardia camponoti]
MSEVSAAPRMSLWHTLLRHDLPASIVVFLVALPLSLGIAVASGAPVAAGLIAAVVGGVVAGALGGSVLQVSGPAAGLTVVVAEAIAQFGWATTCFIGAAAGVLQILFGLSRIARSALAVAPVVVHAMLAGIGITIALQQLHVLFGSRSQSTAFANIAAIPDGLMNLHLGGAAIGIVVIAVMLGWKYLPARVRVVPGPLAAVVIGTLLSLFVIDIERITITGSVFDALQLPQLPTGDWFAVSLTVVTIALIASVESLLSAVAVDKMHSGQRTGFDRELIGQGSANVVSGLVGGLPITGVIVRSATNVSAGARTRASAVLHGVWILLFAVVLVGLVEQVPKAALAGLLIVIGMNLVKLAHIRLARRTGELFVYVTTVVAVVFTNLLEGVLIGLAVAFALLLWRVVRVQISAAALPDGRWHVHLDGSATFLALPKLTGELAKVPAGADVTVEMAVDFLDHAAVEAIEDWRRQHETTGGAVEFIEIGSARMEGTADAPPSRGFGRAAIEDLLGPWRPHGTGVDKVTAGIAAFHRRHAHVVRPHLDHLHDSQDPDSFFLTCSDSRIVPNVITNSGPGDLFTVRNVGNLVPVRGDDSVEAALSFALAQLSVRSVVVCGHSSCGAMKSLLHDAEPGGGLSSWLRHAEPSLRRFRAGHPVAVAARALGYEEVDQLGMVNVAMQLETLHRHPAVRRALRERGITLSGLFFDIAGARVLEVTVDGVRAIDDRAALAVR